MDFYHKYHFDAKHQVSLPAFVDKLQSKHQSENHCTQAQQAVLLYFSLEKKIVQPRAIEKVYVNDKSYQQVFEMPIDKVRDETKLPVNQAQPTRIHTNKEQRIVNQTLDNHESNDVSTLLTNPIELKLSGAN